MYLNMSLDTDGAGQDFTPVKSICAHLNAFHVYADDPKRFVEANHYCSHLTEGTYAHSIHPLSHIQPTHRPSRNQMSASAYSTTARTQAPGSSASST